MHKETVRIKAQDHLNDPVAARLLEQLHFRYEGALRKGNTDTPQSYADLMRDTKFSYKQVRRGLDVLRSSGLIRRRRGLFGNKNVGKYSIPSEVMKWLEGTSECAPEGTFKHALEGTSECAPEGTFLCTGTSSGTSSGTSLSEPQKLAEKDQSSSEGFPGKEEGNGSEEQAEKGSNAVKAEKRVKSVKDVEAAVKAQAVLHKPNTTTALAFIWKKRVAEITKAPAVFKENDFHKLTNFRKACPPGTAAEVVLEHVLDDWIMFVKKVETMAGEKNTPSMPSIGFLLKFAHIAVILATPKKSPPLKHEATNGVPSAKLMQLASLPPTPKPEVQKPQSLAEIWADPDEDDE